MRPTSQLNYNLEAVLKRMNLELQFLQEGFSMEW